MMIASVLALLCIPGQDLQADQAKPFKQSEPTLIIGLIGDSTVAVESGWGPAKEGDNTHFNRRGGEDITDLILPELTKIVPEISALPELQSQLKPDGWSGKLKRVHAITGGCE